MIIDAIIAIALLYGVIRGYGKGLVMAVLSFVGVLIASIAALKLGHVVSEYLQSKGYVSGNFALLVAFLLLFVGIMLVVRLIIKAIEGVLKITMLSWVNKIGGAVLYLALNAFVASMILWLASRVGVANANSLQATMLAKHLLNAAPTMLDALSGVLPFLKEVVAKLKVA
ncbi:MAG: hypothetical protein RL660_1453 [Bacteroidota bacterium]|jgi:membrane protein required for colicin V production